MPAAVRERVTTLLLVGRALSEQWGEGFMDLWREVVMPEALSAVRVRRPLTEASQVRVETESDVDDDADGEDDIDDGEEEDDNDDGEEDDGDDHSTHGFEA